jgi:hypothetical protein
VASVMVGWEPFPTAMPALPGFEFLPDGPVRERVLALASSPSMVEQAGAVGTAARLFVPSGPLAAAMLGVVEDPSTGVAEWLREVDIDALERVAIERAAGLRGEIDDIREELSIDDYLVLARERDVLASVQSLLWMADQGAGLASELRCVDLLGVVKSGYFPEADLPEADAWLLAVATEDPDAWWALWV